MKNVTEEKQENKRPIGLWAVIALTGLMFHRSMAFMMIPELGKTSITLEYAHAW